MRDLLESIDTRKRILKICLILLNLAFLAYWLILAFYSRLHFDDMHFMAKLRELSIPAYVKDMYFSRSGRFVAYIINGVMSIVTTTLGFHHLWAIFYYVLGISICWYVVKDLGKEIPRSLRFLTVCLIYNLFVLTNIDFPVFYWLCAMTYYLNFPIACLILKLVNQERLKGWQWPVLVLAVIYTGGGNEAFTPVALLLLFFNGLYWWRSKGWSVKETWALPQVRHIVWTALAILVLFAVVVIAPGNYGRMSDADHFMHPAGIAGWVKGIVDAVVSFFYFTAFYLPYYAIVFALAFYLGSQIPADTTSATGKGKKILILALSFLAYLIISALPNVYLYSDFGIQRTYTHTVLVLILSICAAGFILGRGRPSNAAGNTAVAGLLALTLIMGINIRMDAPTAKAYARSVDKRAELLTRLQQEGQKDPVIVPALVTPSTVDTKYFILDLLGKKSEKPVLYYYSDATEIDNGYVTIMKDYLGLDFDFSIQ
jgi:hypothetical protein